MLKFRKLNINDLELLRHWRQAEYNSKYLLTNPVITKESQLEWFEKNKNGETYKLWIFSYNDIDVGYITISNIDNINKTGDPGSFVCNADFRGKGLAKHFLYYQAEHAFYTLGLNKIYGPVLTENSSVIATYTKFGYHIEGYFKDHIRKNDTFYDIAYIALLERDWARIKSKYTPMEYIFESY